MDKFLTNRRAFTKGMIAAPALSAIPLSAAPSPMIESPVLGIALKDTHDSFRMLREDGGSRLRLVSERITPSITVQDVAQAEDWFFMIAEGRDQYGSPTLISGEERPFEGCRGPILPIYPITVRSGNIIAALTRRGAGNATFMHPDRLALYEGGPIEMVEPTQVGRWTHVANFLTIKIYVSEQARRDAIFTVYKGSEMDAGLFFFPHKTGHNLAIQPNVSSYIQKINLVGI